MPNKKISQLTSLTTPDSADLFAIVDTSAVTTKKITFANLVAAINSASPSEWINADFDAEYFRGSLGDWTVIESNIITNKYKLDGFTLTWQLYIKDSSVGPSVGQLFCRLPIGIATSQNRIVDIGYALDVNTGVQSLTRLEIDGSAQEVRITRIDGFNFDETSNNQYIGFTMIIEIAH